MNKIDKIYCMSHYVAFRFIKNENINFFEGLKHVGGKIKCNHRKIK